MKQGSYLEQSRDRMKEKACFLFAQREAGYTFCVWRIFLRPFYVYNINRNLFLHFMQYGGNLAKKELISLECLEVYNPFEM